MRKDEWKKNTHRKHANLMRLVLTVHISILGLKRRGAFHNQHEEFKRSRTACDRRR